MHESLKITDEELFYQIALSMVPNMGPAQIRSLLEYFGNATSIFTAKEKELLNVAQMGAQKVASIRSFQDFSAVEEEWNFTQKNDIQIISFLHPAYPQRLLPYTDMPTVLYFKGSANLNQSKIVSIVGTRSNSSYGKSVTENLIEKLAPFNPIIVSGLAYGIDAIAHKAAVKNEVKTIGVVAHGLDRIYPEVHHSLVSEILEKGGGILTEFRQGVPPDRFNFPKRNRIVAAMADATIVVETAKKGGSMITANLANEYGKDVFAVPGKLTDLKSEGCNDLIQTNQAAIYTSPETFVEMMGWEQKPQQKVLQRSLFTDLSEAEQKVVDIILKNDPIFIDDLQLQSHFSSSTLASIILTLELQNIIKPLPGKQYSLI